MATPIPHGAFAQTSFDLVEGSVGGVLGTSITCAADGENGSDTLGLSLAISVPCGESLATATLDVGPIGPAGFDASASASGFTTANGGGFSAQGLFAYEVFFTVAATESLLFELEVDSEIVSGTNAGTNLTVDLCRGICQGSDRLVSLIFQNEDDTVAFPIELPPDDYWVDVQGTVTAAAGVPLAQLDPGIGSLDFFLTVPEPVATTSLAAGALMIASLARKRSRRDP